jgi:hypothetical protein
MSFIELHAILQGSTAQQPPPPLLHVKTDQAHGSTCVWMDDYPNSSDSIPNCPDCKDQGSVEPLLNCRYLSVSIGERRSPIRQLLIVLWPISYTTGPGAYVNQLESFSSFRVIELATDTTDLIRHTLSRHRVTQLLAPHTMENPIFFHATDVSDSGFKTIIDQMAAVGFEMLIYSFGTPFVLETSDPAYLARIKSQVDYARSRGIEVGGYDLICLDRGHGGYGGNVGDEWDVVAPDGSLTVDACFASGWADKLTNYAVNFINQTGLSMLETDGTPYILLFFSILNTYFYFE